MIEMAIPSFPLWSVAVGVASEADLSWLALGQALANQMIANVKQPGFTKHVWGEVRFLGVFWNLAATTQMGPA